MPVPIANPLPAPEVFTDNAYVCIFALQLAFVPLYKPEQFQFHGPVPLTDEGVPALHRFEAGAAVKVCPWDAPHSPFTRFGVKVAVTMQSAVIGAAIYELPDSRTPQPVTELTE